LAGGLGGVAFAGWESAILGWFGAVAPHGPGLWTALALFTAAGAALGALAGLTGLSGGSWSVAVSLLALGVLLSGKVAGVFALGGLPGLLGSVMFMGALAAAAQIAARLPIPPRAQTALAGTLMAWLALCVPLNLHLLPSPFSTLSVSVNLVGLVMAIFAGAVAAMITTEGRPPLIALCGAGLLSWCAAWPVVNSPAVWPVSERSGAPVVLIVIDGLRADRIGSGGYDRDTTPNLDRFARRATRYRTATSPAPWTVPALGSLLTGRLPYEHGAGLHDGTSQRHTAMRADNGTLAFMLKMDGYVTAATTGDMWLDSYGLDWGYMRWNDDAGWGALSASVHPFAMVGLGTFGWPLKRRATALVDDAISFIDRQKLGGWFLLVQFSDLQDPENYEDDAMAALGRSSQPAMSDAYDATLRGLDGQLRRLLEAIPPDAWVVVVGDHGTQLLEQRPQERGVPDGARSGHGMFQELLHVPLLVRVPGRQGRTVGRPVSTMDAMPTLLKGLGVSDPMEREGIALNEIVGGAAPPSERGLVSQCVQYGSEQQAVRMGDHKLVRIASGRSPMFDLASDPLEIHPLPSGARNDQLEKSLGAALTPAGSGAVYGQRRSLLFDLGAFASRIGR